MTGIIVSDIHAGNAVSHAGRVLYLLENEPWSWCALNGDTTDSATAVSPDIFRLFSFLSKQQKNGKTVFYGIGNHDEAVAKIIADGYGFFYYSNEGLTIDGWHIRHGHVGPDGTPWDRYLGGYLGPTAFGNWFEDGLELVGASKVAIKLHHLRKWLFDVKIAVRNESITLAKQNGYKGIITGHTHQPEALDVLSIEGIRYINAGSWCEENDSYAVIENGVGKLIRC